MFNVKDEDDSDGSPDHGDFDSTREQVDTRKDRRYHGHNNWRSLGDVISEATPKKTYRGRHTASVYDGPFPVVDVDPADIFLAVTRTHQRHTLKHQTLLWVTGRDTGDPALGNAELTETDLLSLDIPSTCNATIMDAHEGITRQWYFAITSGKGEAGPTANKIDSHDN